jgi:hypothetical protein
MKHNTTEMQRYKNDINTESKKFYKMGLFIVHSNTQVWRPPNGTAETPSSS